VKFSQSADDSLTSASWYANGQKFVCGGTRGQFYVVVSYSLISVVRRRSSTVCNASIRIWTILMMMMMMTLDVTVSVTLLSTSRRSHHHDCFSRSRI